MRPHKYKRTDRIVKGWLNQTVEAMSFSLSFFHNQTLTKEMKQVIQAELKRFYALGKSVGHGGRW